MIREFAFLTGDPIRVLVLGTGQMGSAIGRLVLEKQGLELVGAYARRSERAGADVGRAIGLSRDLGLRVAGDLASLIDEAHPDVAIQATCSTVADASEEILTLVRSGVSVISIAEEMAFPACSSPAFAKELHAIAVARGTVVLGTGINPGFVLDLLIITLTGVCSDIESISAERVNDLAPYGPSVLASQGVGLTPEEFRRGVKDGTVVGHIGFPESIHMIAAAIGWQIERIEETREPIVSGVRRETPFVTVEPGETAGCFHTAVAYREGKPVIRLSHPQQIHPHLEDVETGDRIEIAGTPEIRLEGSPEIPGGRGTSALAVNMIPRVLNAAPGLYSMADLPVPAALLGDARARLRDSARDLPRSSAEDLSGGGNHD
ncbi:MAG: 2,4-diaminopentanoate dehydrogenase [Planctomycetota bacterium]|jgi:4-hydroxy-tetrahydrodipicolinate reductase